MTRKSAIEFLDSYGGLRFSIISEVVGEMEYEAFTDEALARIAELSHEDALKDARMASRIAKYTP